MSGLLFGRYIDASGKPHFVEIACTSSGSLATTNCVKASDGVLLPIDELPKNWVFNANSSLNYTWVVYLGNTYRETVNYTNGLATSVSDWVKQ